VAGPQALGILTTRTSVTSTRIIPAGVIPPWPDPVRSLPGALPALAAAAAGRTAVAAVALLAALVTTADVTAAARFAAAS
jgi:hypothetical protein